MKEVFFGVLNARKSENWGNHLRPNKSEEFGGSFFAPNFGVNVVFNANEDIGISTGINFHNLSSSKTSQNGEKLNIINTQLAVGIIINL